jgi:lipoprotein-anchoring transpeptidase ErfK/SrfK
LGARGVVLLGMSGGLLLVGGCLLMLLIGFGVVYSSGRVLPGVRSAGVDLGNMTEETAAQTLTDTWNGSGLILRDGDRTWAVNPNEIGVTIDASATAHAAAEYGRANGGFSAALKGIVGKVDVDPVLVVDLAVLSAYLDSAKAQLDQPAVNAGVRLVGGQAVASPASDGREINVAATVERMRIDAAGELADGALDLDMISTYPAITDASPLVAQANALLTSPFTVNAYDPIRDEWHHWSAPPELWSAWLEAESAPGSATGLALSLNPTGPIQFLQSSSSSFGDERYISLEEAITDMQNALANGQPTAMIRVWHNETTYTVQAGQTLASIAEDLGMPYPYIQAANPGINTDSLSIGQTLTIPSKDSLAPLAPIPNKRIIISRSQQHLWAYEDGQVVFDWVISTGLPSSPTALGVFQVQSHELNAYADQWNLYMPHFMGFYHPGPNMDLMNGFHGFPTRGGGYLLWSGDLGHPVTYGCVLLSLENAEALYNWAEEGVVVEVRA